MCCFDRLTDLEEEADEASSNNGENLTFKVHSAHGRFLLFQHLLEGQYSTAQPIWEISGVQSEQLPNAGDQGTSKGRCFAGPDSHKQGRTHERCEYQRQSCCSDHDMLPFRILQGESEVKSGIQSWTSGEQILSSSGIHLKESHGVQRWREVSRRLG